MPVSPFSIWVSFGLSNSTGRDVGASTAGVARLPYCVFDIFYDVKRDDIRMDISCDVFGNRRDHPETYLGYVGWNGDYCSTAVCRSLAFKIIITLL